MRSKVILCVVALTALIAALACSSAQPTATPIPPTPTTAVSTPTSVTTQQTPTRIPATPTSVPQSQIQYGGNLRVITVNGEPPATLLPGYAASFNSRTMFYAMGNTLLRYAPDFSIHPELAESWDVSADGKVITFHLRKDVKFHDGTPFDAQAVKWNIDLNLNRENAPVLDPKLQGITPYLDLRSAVDKFTVVDNYTVTFALKQPFRPFLTWMADVQGFVMISPDAAKKSGPDTANKFVGTGPFKFTRFILDQDLRIEKNPNYWELGKPYLDRITYLPVRDRSVALAMVRTQELELFEVDPRDLPTVRNNPKLKADPFQSSTFDGLQFRVTKEPWTKKSLRQAVAYAIDKQKVIDVLYAGAGRVAQVSEGDKLWWSDPTLKSYEYDLTKAKQKMAEAGYPNGVTVEMGCSTPQWNIEQCEFFQAQLAQIGINIQIRPTPTLYTDMLQGKVNFRIAPGWSPRADPDTRLRIIHHSKGSNFVLTEYKNEEIDRLLDQAVGVYDQAEARKLYSQVQKLAADDASWIFVVLLTRYMAMQDYVQNHTWYEDGYLRAREIWLKR